MYIQGVCRWLLELCVCTPQGCKLSLQFFVSLLTAVLIAGEGMGVTVSIVPVALKK
jgi:hypothetical protein